MTNNKTVACYLRVSTTEQNLDSQRAEINAYLHNHGIDMSRVVFYEDKESGAKLDRPAFEKLQRDILRGRVSTVIVWKLDRLSRDLRGGINVLSDWAERGLKVVSVTQDIEFNGALGKLIAAILLGVAEMELSTLKERQRAGIEAAKKAGKFIGRKRGTFKGSAARVRQLRDKGNTPSEIAKSLGISERTVFRYLKHD